jgi:hypothetical protein
MEMPTGMRELDRVQQQIASHPYAFEVSAPPLLGLWVGFWV